MKRSVKGECTECGGQMVEGALVDYRRYEAAAGEWVAGDVVTSVWTGAIKNPERFIISAYRCEDCGLLKLYARELAQASAWLG
jgi:hypothetical protein